MGGTSASSNTNSVSVSTSNTTNNTNNYTYDTNTTITENSGNTGLTGSDLANILAVGAGIINRGFDSQVQFGNQLAAENTNLLNAELSLNGHSYLPTSGGGTSPAGNGGTSVDTFLDSSGGKLALIAAALGLAVYLGKGKK